MTTELLFYIIGFILSVIFGIIFAAKSNEKECKHIDFYSLLTGLSIIFVAVIFSKGMNYLFGQYPDVKKFEPFNEYYYNKLLEDDCSVFTVRKLPNSTVYVLKIGEIQQAIKVEIMQPDIIYRLEHNGEDPEPKFDYLNNRDDHVSNQDVIRKEVKAMSLGKIKKYIESRNN